MSGQLREMVEADLPMVLAWRNRDDVRVNMYTHHHIAEEEHRAWWARESVNPRTRLLIFEIDGTPVGVVAFTCYTGHNGIASWAFYSGDPTRRGIGPQMEEAALRYAFEVLQLRKLECEVLSFNDRVASFHRKFGFRLEGTFRKAYERDGVYYDILRLALLAEDWQRGQQKDQPRPLTGKSYRKTVVISRELVARFADVTGDHNPIHVDADAARAAGFPDCIAHGMLTGGLISAIFATEFPGPGSVYRSQSIAFLKPIPVGSECEFVLKVMSQTGRRVEIETKAMIGELLCATGEAVLLLPAQEDGNHD